MPIYDFTCLHCNKTHEKQYAHSSKDTLACVECGTEMKHDFPAKFGTTGWPENGITMEHVGPKPVHFKSRTEAKKYARENKVELGCL